MNSPQAAGTITTVSSIPLRLPERAILSRLGHNRHRTALSASQHARVNAELHEGFSLCAPCGRFTRDLIVAREGNITRLASGRTLESISLQEVLAKSDEVVFLAATVGSAIVTAIQDAIRVNNGARAAIFDAVGSETVDAALDWLQQYVAQTLTREGKRMTRRYSPGYGDLPLENQCILFDQLKLQEIGLRLTPRFLLIPEKSVLGIAGIER